MRTVAPAPGTTVARPPWASAIVRTIERPSPVPSRVRARSPRANGSKARLAQAQLVGIHELPVLGVDADGASALAGAVGKAPADAVEQLAELELLGSHR